MSKNHLSKSYHLAISALIAAVYAVLTFAFSPISFGVIQLRISEILVVLPLFTVCAIPGLSVGCLIANLIGFFMGQSMIWDLFFGTFATLLASVLTYGIGKLQSHKLQYLFGPLPPVLCNGLIVGLEISVFFGGVLLWNVLIIMLEEFIICYIFGEILLTILYKNNIYRKIFPF